MKTVGKRIFFVRSEILKISQGAFADLIGVSGPSTVNNWEKDTREPEIKYLTKIAAIGNVSLDWLLAGMSSQENKLREEVNKKNEEIEKLKREKEILSLEVSQLHKVAEAVEGYNKMRDKKK